MLWAMADGDAAGRTSSASATGGVCGDVQPTLVGGVRAAGDADDGGLYHDEDVRRQHLGWSPGEDHIGRGGPIYPTAHRRARRGGGRRAKGSAVLCKAVGTDVHAGPRRAFRLWRRSSQDGAATAHGKTGSASARLSDKLNRAMAGGRLRFTECVEVTEDGWADVRLKPTRKLWGARLAMAEELSFAALHHRPLPVGRKPPGSVKPDAPYTPTEQEQAGIGRKHPNREVCFEGERWRQIEEYHSKMARDAGGCREYGGSGEGAWRVRMKSGRADDEYRIMHEMHAASARGAYISIGQDGKPELTRPVPMRERMEPVGSVIIKFHELLAWMLAHDLPDHFMEWVCEWGWKDMTDGRPIVVSLSPNMPAAYERFQAVCVAHQLEIDRKWCVVFDHIYRLQGRCISPRQTPSTSRTARLDSWETQRTRRSARSST